jgi:hypothetical protein
LNTVDEFLGHRPGAHITAKFHGPDPVGGKATVDTILDDLGRIGQRLVAGLVG